MNSQSALRAFAIGWTITVIASGCAFKSPVSAKNPNSLSNNEPQLQPGSGLPNIPPMQVIWSYGEQAKGQLSLPYDAKTGAYSNTIPFVIPVPAPAKLTLEVENGPWASLESSARIAFGSEIREIHTESKAKEEKSRSATTEIEIQGLDVMSPNKPGLSQKLEIEIRSQGEKKELELTFLTAPLPPALTESDLPDAQRIPEVISGAKTAMPLKRYEFRNTTTFDNILETPIHPDAKLLQQFKDTTFSQVSCSVTTQTSTRTVVYSEQFLLVREGSGPTELAKFLSDPNDSKSVQKLPSAGSLAFILYAIYDSGRLSPNILGRMGTAPAKMLSPTCAPSVCRTKMAYFKRYNWSNTDCTVWWDHTPVVKDGSYCKYPYDSGCDHNGNCDLKGHKPEEIEFGPCKEFYIDPIAAIPYYDFSEAVGAGLTTSSLLNAGRVYYDGIPLLSPDQASSLPQTQSQEVLFGSFGF